MVGGCYVISVVLVLVVVGDWTGNVNRSDQNIILPSFSSLFLQGQSISVQCSAA
jgi:hypothetical protein